MMKRNTVLTLPLWLCVALPALSQPVMEVDNQRQWMGELIWKTPKNISYEVENTGDEPLLIKELHPSCGCVSVVGPKDSIPAGEKGKISAVYDAATLGTFYREIAVWTNASEEPVYLVFEGRVVLTPSDVDYDTDFPIDLGGIRMSSNVIEFDDVNKGDRPVAELRVLNLKKEDFTPQLMHIPAYLSVEYYPQVIQGGRVGKVRLTLDSEKLMMDGLNQSSLYMARYEGDKVGADNEVILSAVLLPSFANLTASEMERAPRILLTDGLDTLQRELTLRPGKRNFLKRGGSKISKTVTVENEGEEELDISAVQVFNPAVSVSLGNRVIPPHGKEKLKVTVDTKALLGTKSRPRLILISNDPRNAKTLLGINMEE